MRRLILAFALLAGGAAQAETPVPENSPDPLARTLPVPVVAPEAKGSFFLGASHSALTSGYGTWNAAEARLVVEQGSNTWYGDVARREQFNDQGTAFGAGLSHVFNPDWYASGFISGSSGGFFLPQRRIDLFLHRKWLDDRSLVTTVGIGHVDAKDGHRDNSLFLAATLYTQSKLVLEGGVRFNRSDPGQVDSTRPFLAVTWGEAKRQYLSARIESGREAYQLISPGAAISDFHSTLATVGWRRWITKDSGIQLTGEYYENPNYRRRGIGLAFFRDF